MSELCFVTVDHVSRLMCVEVVGGAISMFRKDLQKPICSDLEDEKLREVCMQLEMRR